jgi:23S rRNA (cytosine1962-C5)-methyltransferase
MPLNFPKQKEYELLDSGDGKKLERYGDIVLARPDPQIIWAPKLSSKEWEAADAIFQNTTSPMRGEDKDDADREKGKWHIRNKKLISKNADGGNDTEQDASARSETSWPIELGSIKMYARLTPFKHTGIFQEQLINWQWMEEILSPQLISEFKTAHNRAPRILNLFGYSGGASIVCAKAGAEVTHVDASRAAITWAKENMLLTGLDEKAIRWILEDAVQFIKKEARRGNTYDAILMDPPVFGRGAKGEVWKIERDLRELLEISFSILSKTPLFFILNGYASGYSAESYGNTLEPLLERFGGSIEAGELLIPEASSVGSVHPRHLSCGIVARWKSA